MLQRECSLKQRKPLWGEDWFEIGFDSANASGSDAMFHNHKFPLRISGPCEIFKTARPPRVHAIMIISAAMLALAAFHASVGRGEKDGAALAEICFVLQQREKHRRNIMDLKLLDLQESNPHEAWSWIQVLYLVRQEMKFKGGWAAALATS